MCAGDVYHNDGQRGLYFCGHFSMIQYASNAQLDPSPEPDYMDSTGIQQMPAWVLSCALRPYSSPACLYMPRPCKCPLAVAFCMWSPRLTRSPHAEDDCQRWSDADACAVKGRLRGHGMYKQAGELYGLNAHDSTHAGIC